MNVKCVLGASSAYRYIIDYKYNIREKGKLYTIIFAINLDGYP